MTGESGAAAEIEPLDVTGSRTVAVGAALWFAAFCLLLLFRDSLSDSGREWWLWTCVAGFTIGVIGTDYCRRRQRRLERRPDLRPETSPLGAAGP